MSVPYAELGLQDASVETESELYEETHDVNVNEVWDSNFGQPQSNERLFHQVLLLILD